MNKLWTLVASVFYPSRNLLTVISYLAILVTFLTVTIVSRCRQLVNTFFQKKTIFSHITLSTTLAIANISIDATTNDDTINRATSAVYISFSVLNFLLMRYTLLSILSAVKSYADHPTRDSAVYHTKNNCSANRSIDYYMNNIYNRN